VSGTTPFFLERGGTMSENKQVSVDGDDTWSAGRLVVIGIITLILAFGIINAIAETGIGKT
jgi:hypothetical protein